MPAPPTHLSPSGFSTWNECRRKWWGKYQEDFPPDPPSIQMVRGTFVHEVLEHLLWMPSEARTLDSAQAIATTLWRAWVDLGAYPAFTDLDLQPGDRVEFAAWAWSAIKKALRIIRPTEIDVAALELRVDVTLGGVPFHGFIDMIERGSDGLVVNDYKTGERPERGKPWTKATEEKALLQPLLYAAALRSMGHDVQEVALVYVPADGRSGVLSQDATDPALDAAESALADAWESVNDLCDGGSMSDAPPSPSALCGWCPFVAVCPEGTAAVRERMAEGRNIGPAAERLAT